MNAGPQRTGAGELVKRIINNVRSQLIGQLLRVVAPDLTPRLKDAGLPTHCSPHSIRVTSITDLLEQGVPLEDVQRLAGPR